MSKEKLIPELRFPEFVLEGNWIGDTLINIAKFRRGSFPQPYGLPEWYDEFNGIPFIQVFDVGDNFRLKPTTKNKISKLAAEQSVFVPKGTVIITIQGSIGRVAITQYDAYIDRTLLLFEEFYNEMDKIFFAYVLFMLFEIEKEKAPGGIIKTITKEVLSDFKIKIPKLPEQQKIASCLSSFDEVIAAHNQKLELLKYHKKGLMQNLFPQEGEKVPKLRFKEFENDGEWVKKKLEDIAELTSSKRVHLADYVLSGVPFFRGKEISQLKNNQVPNDILYISNEQYKEIKDKYEVPKKGDILITAVGTLGNVYCIKNDDEFYFKDGNLIWMKNISIDSHFLEVLLDVEKEKVLASAIGSSQKALTMATLNKIEFQIPQNLKEQQKIADCLSSLDELIIAQVEKIEQLKWHKKGLMQGLFPSLTD